jgi:hypothetical protein
MDYLKLLSISGLSLDIVGAILLYFYGIPKDLNPNGYIFKTLEQVDKKEIAEFKIYKKRILDCIC